MSDHKTELAELIRRLDCLKKMTPSFEQLAEKFLVNIDDQLDLIKDLRYLKSMFTLDKVTNRKAFDKYNPNRARICSFVASVNSSEFLTDDQNRRYLVFSVKDIDFKASEKLGMLFIA